MAISWVSGFSKTTIRVILVIWGLCAAATAFFIPVYDFGMDGVAVWLFICLLLLFAISFAVLVLKILQKRLGNLGSARE